MFASPCLSLDAYIASDSCVARGMGHETNASSLLSGETEAPR